MCAQRNVAPTPTTPWECPMGEPRAHAPEAIPAEPQNRETHVWVLMVWGWVPPTTLLTCQGQPSKIGIEGKRGNTWPSVGAMRMAPTAMVHAVWCVPFRQGWAEQWDCQGEVLERGRGQCPPSGVRAVVQSPSVLCGEGHLGTLWSDAGPLPPLHAPRRDVHLHRGPERYDPSLGCPALELTHGDLRSGRRAH